MSQLNCNTKSKKGKRLKYEDRIKLEALQKVGLKPVEIAKQLGD